MSIPLHMEHNLLYQTMSKQVTDSKEKDIFLSQILELLNNINSIMSKDIEELIDYRKELQSVLINENFNDFEFDLKEYENCLEAQEILDTILEIFDDLEEDISTVPVFNTYLQNAEKLSELYLAISVDMASIKSLQTTSKDS